MPLNQEFNLWTTENDLFKDSQFLIKQYFNLISPDNFLLTNPAVMQKTLQSGGMNLFNGFNRLLNDFDHKSGQIKITRTDKKIFKPGENIACTPGNVVFKNDLIELIQYNPTTTTTYTNPLLCIPPWINKYYILDLSQHNSLVKYLVSQGITVYMISWANPNKKFSNYGLFDYMQEGPMKAIQFIQQHHQLTKINALGFCLGGTLLAMLNSYYQSIGLKYLKSTTYLATMLDFSDIGDLAFYLNPYSLTFIKQHIKLKGYLSGDFLNLAFSSLRSKELIWSFMVKNYLEDLPPKPMDFLYWNDDATNLPEKMYLEYLEWMLLNNRLIQPGQISFNNQQLDIQKINIPSYFIAAQNDHIAPWKTVYNGFKLHGGKKKFILCGSGHIAGIINPPNQTKYGYNIHNRYSEEPDKWLKKSSYHQGSWWPAWSSWLQKLSGKQINSSTIKPKKIISPAPGEYIFTSHENI